MNAIELLRQRAADRPADAAAHYGLGIAVLDECLRGPRDPERLRDATDALRRAVELGPSRPSHHAALGFALDLGGDAAAEALACFREAHRLAPDNGTFEVFVIALLAETGKEQEALEKIVEAADRHAVDLPSLQERLRSEGVAIDVSSIVAHGFLDPREFFASWLRDEIAWLASMMPSGPRGGT